MALAADTSKKMVVSCRRKHTSRVLMTSWHALKLSCLNTFLRRGSLPSLRCCMCNQHVRYWRAMTQRAYSYIRFSSPEQAKGDSLRRQTEAAEAYAKERGLSLDSSLTFRDLGISAF